MTEQEYTNKIESLERQLAVEQQKNSVSLRRIRSAMEQARGALALLHAAECAMCGMPEPKRG